MTDHVTPDMEIGDDPMLCHLCGKDIPGSAIVGHLTVEHGGGVSAVSPDEARELARLLIAAADACDAYDLPDADDGGGWWFPRSLPQTTAERSSPKSSDRLPVVGSDKG